MIKMEGISTNNNNIKAVEFTAMLKKTVSPNKVRESLIDNPELSDLTLTLGSDEEELNAHKIFLITASPVFHDVLVNKIKQNNNNDDIPNLKFPTISKATMMEICRYCYSDNPKFTKENMMNILQAAKGLQMQFLVERAIEFIACKGLDEKTVFDVIEYNMKVNVTKLSLNCFNFIKKNAAKCFESETFLDASSEVFKIIIQNCDLTHTIGRVAIDNWSRNIDNLEDVDEMEGLLNLYAKDDNQPSDDDQSDDNQSVISGVTSIAESVNSQMSINSKKSTRNQDKRRGGRNNVYELRSREIRNSGAAAVGAVKNRGGQQRVRDNSEKGPSIQLKQAMNFQQNAIQSECIQNPLLKNVAIDGDLQLRRFTFSNLNFTVLVRISLTEIGFCYDLSKYDEHVEFYIKTAPPKINDIYYDKIQTSVLRNNKYRYKLVRPCNIDGGQKLWISLKFEGENKQRPTFYGNIGTNQNAFIALDPNNSKNGQVVSNILFNAV